MTFQSEVDATMRETSWVVKVIPDQCDNTYSQAPCTATGTPCYYTFPECQDQANYVKSSRDYIFSEQKGPLIPDTLPYLKTVKLAPQKIDSKNELTQRGDVTVTFTDDDPHARANSDKARAFSNAEMAGSFWKNFFARNPNLEGRLIEVYQGFESISLANFELQFRGIITDFDYRQGQATIKGKDQQYKLLLMNTHLEQDEDNVLTVAYAGGANINVTDASQFPVPTMGTLPHAGYEIVRVGSEWARYSGVDTGNNRLTGAAYVYDGAGTEPIGSRVRLFTIYAEDTGQDPDDEAGFPADLILMDVIFNKAGISSDSLATVDDGATLTAGVAAGDLLIPVSDLGLFPEQGSGKIDNEFFRWNAHSGSNLVVAKRGEYSTTAAAHLINAVIEITTFSRQYRTWMQGLLFKRKLPSPLECRVLVNQLRQQSMMHVWQGEDGKIYAKAVAPPIWGDVIQEITDDDIVDGSVVFNEKMDNRLSRIGEYYKPNVNYPMKEFENYNRFLQEVDAVVESSNWYNDIKNKEYFGQTIYRKPEALALASRTLSRFRIGAPNVKFKLELKDRGLVLGETFRLTTSEIVNTDGTPREKILFEVLQKKYINSNTIEILAEDMNLSRRYPVISPAAINFDYDAASDDEKQKYGWIGNANNEVGTPAVDGYYIY